MYLGIVVSADREEMKNFNLKDVNFNHRQVPKMNIYFSIYGTNFVYTTVSMVKLRHYFRLPIVIITMEFNGCR